MDELIFDPMNLKRLNLNHLPVLESLLETRNVTRTAEKLGMTQPTVSTILSRLRQQLNDELLVKVGRDMHLSPAAEQLRAPLQQLLQFLEVAFDGRRLHASKWSGEFIIATTDYISVLLLPPLQQQLVELEQPAAIRVVNMTRVSQSALRNDEIDLVICPPQMVSDQALKGRHLLKDRFVCVRWQGNDMGEKPLSLQEYLSHRHVATDLDSAMLSSAGHTSFSEDLDRLRRTQMNVSIIPDYSVLPLLILGTPHLALIQEKLYRRLKEFLPIRSTPAPVRLPELDLWMFWSPRMHRDPAHKWMRDTIAEICEHF